MNKKDLVIRIAKKRELPVSSVQLLVDDVLEEILSIIHEGNTLELRGFGIFDTRTRAEKVVHNPRSKLEVVIPQSKIMTFRFTKTVQQDFIQKQKTGK